MKTSKSGCRINKNGKVITAIEKEAFTSPTDCGRYVKHDGTYYFFNRIQNGVYIYLP